MKDVSPTGKGVSRTASVTATFSEAMDEGSVEAQGTIQLVRKGTTDAIPATVTYDPATKRLKLDPDATLARGASYTATVSTAAEDTAGNALATPKTWTFTTKR